MTFCYRPHIPDHVDDGQLLNEISSFFRLNCARLDDLWQSYKDLSIVAHYAELLGERKTLSLEEAFIICIIVGLFRCKTIVEIGTQYGRSTRRIIDIKNSLGIDGKVVTFDIVDQVKYFTPNEAKLILKDVTWSFRSDVLDPYKPDFIFLDAHPYHLIKNVVQGVLEERTCILAIHDCSRGLCNPKMTLSKDDPNVTSDTGCWERHVLAEIFGIEDPLSPKLDYFRSSTHLLKIFETPHGLAVILPVCLLNPRLDR